MSAVDNDHDDDPPPMPLPGHNHHANSIIQPLPIDSIRRIVAGQAILDLSSCVKELIDNALDAGSTNINVRLFGKGLEIIEISDDGCGVPMESRHIMALPHTTSKINSLNDIYHPPTNTYLGFRGEALYSLANLSHKLIVATRCAGEESAQKLEFGHDGTVLSSLDNGHNNTTIPRKIGTTVAVVQLLQPLPVRRRDLERRLTTYRQKLVLEVTAYAIFRTGVCLRLMDVATTSSTTTTGSDNKSGGQYQEKIIVASSFQNATLRETVSAVLGPKFLAGLVDFYVDLTSVYENDDEETAQQQGDDNVDDGTAVSSSSSPSQPTTTTTNNTWFVRGLISSACCRRSSSGTTDRSKTGPQLLYAIHKRPVEMPKLSRLLKQTFQRLVALSSSPDAVSSRSSAASMSVILDFSIPHHRYDVNLAPDKKTVLLAMEDQVMECIVAAATALWSSQAEGRFVVRGGGGATAPTPSTTMMGLSSAVAVPKPPQQHQQRRRYAFVHDPSSAITKEREEHEKRFQFNETKRNNSTAVAARMTTTATSTHDDENDEEADDNDDDVCVMEQDERKRPANSDDSIRKEQRNRNARDLSTIGTTTTAMRLDDHVQQPPRKAPPPSHATAAAVNSSFAASWKEKQKWRETQARFNSQDEEEEDDDPAAIVAPAPPLKQRRFGLERFGFLSSSSTVPRVSDRTPRVVSDNNVAEQARRDGLASYAPTRRYNEDLTPTMYDDDHHDGTPAKKARIVSIEKRPFDDNNAAMADDLVEEKEDDDTFVLVPSPSASSVSTVTDPTPSRANNLPRIQDIDDGGDKVKTSVLGPPEALGEATSSPSASSVQARKVSEVQTSPVENDIVWLHLGSTEDVKADYRSERRSLSMRKRKLKEMKNAETTEGAPAAEASIRLKKEEFRDMQIIGQYNMGFILAQDAGGNVWILDQHACDEKHKFEKLCAETTIHDQRLMAPLPLELSSLQEACIQDNLAVFEKNGFRFQYDDGQPPGRRCALTALPHSGAQNGRNAVQYGKDDVLALCALLMGEDVDGGTGTDGTGMYGNNAVRRYASCSQHGQVDTIMARLPKTIAMFASRACRTSIMVGTALSRREMEKLVHRLTDLEQPWNCPHGRPTLQHVRRLRTVLLDDEKRTAALIAEPTVTVLSQEADDDVEDDEQSE